MIPEEIFNKRILISSLNWGMGHVARCIPLIRKLNNNENNIWIACSENQKSVYLNYFPNINYLNLNDFPFKFKGKGYFALDIFFKFPHLCLKLIKEKKQVNEWVKEFDFDLIISDQRYSFRSNKAYSVFLTHQLTIPKFSFSFFFQKSHDYHLNKFNQIWICDFENSLLAGDLSNSENFSNVKYIGPLSRFDNICLDSKKGIDSTLILSGPKPYHKFLLEYFLKKARQNTQIHIITPFSISEEFYNRFPILNQVHVNLSNNWSQCDAVIRDSKMITSYSGYSTLMDLYYLKIKSDLIATPGQKEQIYLHKLHVK